MTERRATKEYKAFCQKISLWCSQNLHQGLTSGNMCEIIWNWKPCCFLKRKCAICKWCVEWGGFCSNYFCCCLKRNSVLQVWIVLCKRKLMVALFVCASPSGWVWVVVGFLMQPRPPPPHTTSLYSLANNNDIKRWTLVQAPQPPLSKKGRMLKRIFYKSPLLFSKKVFLWP